MSAKPSKIKPKPIGTIDVRDSILGLIAVISDGYGIRNLLFGNDEDLDMTNTSLNSEIEGGLSIKIKRIEYANESGYKTKNLANGNENKYAYRLGKDALTVEAHEQIGEYLRGQRKIFNLNLKPIGTPFQRKVWDALLNIPFGKTCSYGQLASKLGNEKACRAVGNALNKNPIPLLIPCHRVLGGGGTLGGYSCGSDLKRKLLELEGVCI